MDDICVMKEEGWGGGVAVVKPSFFIKIPNFIIPLKLEPFDAYVWRVAGASALTIAVIGLVASLFVPLAKWSMLLAGNYRCVTPDGMRTAQEAVHSNLAESKSVYNFVFDLCVKLGANPNDLVPFEKYG